MPRRNRRQEIDYLEGDDMPSPSSSPARRAIWIAAIVTVALLVALAFGSQWASLSALDKREAELKVAVARAQAENAQLEERRDRAATDAGAEEALRDLGWLKQGETAIVPRPEPSGAQGRQPFQPERDGRLPPNWQRWWQWFFGSDSEKSPR